MTLVLFGTDVEAPEQAARVEEKIQQSLSQRRRGSYAGVRFNINREQSP